MGPRARRHLLLALLACLAAPLALASAASGNAIAPESGGSPNADNLHSLYLVLLVIAAIVFVGVEGILLYSVLRFRKRKGLVAAQIRGNTRLEIGWTVATAVVLLGLTVLTFAELNSIKNPVRSGPSGFGASTDANLYASLNQPRPPGGHGLRIEVTGLQYVWRFTYPNRAYAYEEMVVPTNTTVLLDIDATDVIHSWWIPKLGGQFDATPGRPNHSWFKIPARLAGHSFGGQCAELCGRGHANMLARVRAVTPDQFRVWLSQKQREINQAYQAAAAAAVVQDPLAKAGG